MSKYNTLHTEMRIEITFIARIQLRAWHYSRSHPGAGPWGQAGSSRSPQTKSSDSELPQPWTTCPSMTLETSIEAHNRLIRMNTQLVSMVTYLFDHPVSGSHPAIPSPAPLFCASLRSPDPHCLLAQRFCEHSQRGGTQICQALAYPL